ncbi:DUF1269 domain-containing protein, partial [Burkholderia pseudomallei]
GGAGGGGCGAGGGSVVGGSVANTRLKDVGDEGDNSALLMMIDVHRDRVEEIEALVKQHHPNAHLEGTDPTIPAFP